MKKTIIFTLVVFACYITTHAQQLRVIVQPNTSPPVFLQDTLWIGFHPDATAGIDESLGEEDISKLPPFGNMDVRIIQNSINRPED